MFETEDLGLVDIAVSKFTRFFCSGQKKENWGWRNRRRCEGVNAFCNVVCPGIRVVPRIYASEDRCSSRHASISSCVYEMLES